MSQIDDQIVLPLKRCLLAGKDMSPLEAMQIEENIKKWNDEFYHHLIFDGLGTAYSDYVAGKINPRSYMVTNILQLLIDLDVFYDKVIDHIDIVETALSWAEHNTELRLNEFLKVLCAYDLCNTKRDWEEIELRLQKEIMKLEVYGNKVKGGYLTVLHGFIRITRSNTTSEEKKVLRNLFKQHWDYLRLVYSLMIRSIVDCGHRDFAGVANNARIMKSHHPYIHIFRVVLKERIDDLCKAGTSREKLENHLTQILIIEKGTPQDYNLLDDLCTILFPESFQNYLENNRMKSYDEIANELKEVKSQVEALNNQVSQMAKNMANAVKAAIPLEDIERELLRLSPGTSFDVFTQLNALLIGNRAWLENASRIKDKVIALRECTITQNNVTLELVQKKETNIGTNYGPNIENNGTLSLPNKDDQ